MGRPKTSAWMIVPNLLRTLVRGDVTLKSKLILLGGLAYLVSPIDFFPDVVIGFGWLDDLVIVPLLGWLSYRSLPKKVQEDIVSADDGDKKSTRRVYLYLGVLIIAVITIVVMGSGENPLGPTDVPQVGK